MGVLEYLRHAVIATAPKRREDSDRDSHVYGENREFLPIYPVSTFLLLRLSSVSRMNMP